MVISAIVVGLLIPMLIKSNIFAWASKNDKF
jgi:hypothetical protein